jgi:sugar phosphate isomerase/epimerase
MRLRHIDGQTVHLVGSLAAEPDDDLRELLTRLSSYNGDLTCCSLSLTPALASALAGSIGMRRRLQLALNARGLEVVTLQASVLPRSWRDWWTYLLDLAYILADLLPEDTTHGSICTSVPLLGADPWETAARELEDLGSGLTEIAWHTGSFIRVACAQQDGTLLTSIDDACRLLASVDPARIGVCLDPGRLVRLSETPAQALVKLRRARLNVVKVKLAEPGFQSLLNAVLGGPHALCDHIEATTPQTMTEARLEMSILGLDGADDRPIPGLGRSVA